LTGLVRKAGAAATPPPPEIIGAAASRIGDGGAAEGSSTTKAAWRLYGNHAISVSASFLWKSYGTRTASVQRLYGDTAGLRCNALASKPHCIDSRINCCIRVSEYPRVTRLSSHGFTQTVLSLRLSLACCSSRTTTPRLQCICLDCNLRLC